MADLINVNQLVICLPADGLDLVDPADTPIHSVGFTLLN